MGPRTLFIASVLITAGLLQWMHQLRLGANAHGLTNIFFVLFAYEDYIATMTALLILGVAVFVTPRLPVARILRTAGERPFAVAAIAGVVLCAGTLLVYHDHPLSMDEYAAYFQGQVFARGHLSGQLPPPVIDWLIPPGFQNFFLTVDRITGQVAETYWPAFSLILAPFALVGAPWACNAVLSAFTLIAIHRLAMLLFQNVEAAGLALLLTVASPVFFGIGISYYAMQAHLLANCLYALLLLTPTVPRALVAGVVGSVALTLHQPVPHILFCIPWLAWIASRPERARLLAALAAGYLPLCLLIGVGWFEFSAHLSLDGASPTVGAGGDGSFMARLMSRASIFSLPSAPTILARLVGLAKVWIWAVPGLLILAAAGAWRGRGNTHCRLFTASALLTYFGYFLVPVDQGHGWGYRYFHSAWMALPLLAAAALYGPVGEPAREPGSAGPGSGARTGTGSGIYSDPGTRHYVVACVLLTLVFGLGWRAWEMEHFMAFDLDQLPHYRGTERRVVIIDDSHSFYGGDLVQNDPWLRGNEIRMYSHGRDEDAKMMAQYFPELHLVRDDLNGTVWSEANVVPYILRPLHGGPR